MPALASPPSATGTTWSNSRNPVSSQRLPSADTNEQRRPSRATACRRTSFGMVLFARPGFAARGLFTWPNRLRSTWSRNRSSTRSSTAERSPDGTWWRRCPCARRSFSRVAPPIVSWSANLSSESAATRGGTGGTGSGTTSPPATSIPCSATRSSRAGTSGRGALRARTISSSALLFPAASATSSSTFSSARCGASSTTAVRCSRPAATASATTGYRLSARAARIRLNASSSDMPSTRVQ